MPLLQLYLIKGEYLRARRHELLKATDYYSLPGMCKGTLTLYCMRNIDTYIIYNIYRIVFNLLPGV